MSLYRIAQKLADDQRCLLFVYGTLMQGEDAYDQLSGAEFLGPAMTAPKYSLLELGDDFPALAQGNNQISGELYLLTPEIMAKVDDWEYDVYSREPIELADGRFAYAYVV